MKSSNDDKILNKLHPIIAGVFLNGYLQGEQGMKVKTETVELAKNLILKIIKTATKAGGK